MQLTNLRLLNKLLLLEVTKKKMHRNELLNMFTATDTPLSKSTLHWIIYCLLVIHKMSPKLLCTAHNDPQWLSPIDPDLTISLPVRSAADLHQNYCIQARKYFTIV